MVSAGVFCVALAVYHEARGEELAGQFAVAEVVHNRVADPRWPDHACEVVFQDRQFAFVVDGVTPPITEPDRWVDALSVAMQSEATEGGPVFFHSGKGPWWTKHYKKRFTIGGHTFYGKAKK